MKEPVPVFGMQAVAGLLAQDGQVDRLLVAEGRAGRLFRQLVALAQERGIPVKVVSRSHLDQLAQGGSHQGIAALGKSFRYAGCTDILAGIKDPALLLVLDGVQDPRNLGAILRTAAATGFQGVFIPDRRAVGVTPTVLKAAAGTGGLVPVARESSLDALLSRLEKKGIWRIAVVPGACPPWEAFDFTLPVALVVGGEGRGLRPLLRRRCDARVGLPMQV
ncbi:MAG: TrmH family RNA methyltransferase, partial [Acidobacteriota bacterium]